MSEKSMLEIAANAAKRYSRVEKKLDGDFKEVSKHIEKARAKTLKRLEAAKEENKELARLLHELKEQRRQIKREKAGVVADTKALRASIRKNIYESYAEGRPKILVAVATADIIREFRRDRMEYENLIRVFKVLSGEECPLDQNERTYLSAFRSIMRTLESNMSKYVELKKCEEDQPKPKRAAAKAIQEIMEQV